MKERPLWSLSLVGLIASACNGNGELATYPAEAFPLPGTNPVDPVNPAPPAQTPENHETDVLLFNGTGVSTSDWQNTEMIIRSIGLSYRLANSPQLNAMSLEEIVTQGAPVVPSYKGDTITSALSTTTRLKLRQPVRDHGIGYVGFCAGAWVAVGPEADTDSTASYGPSVAEGCVLPSYWPGGNPSLVADMVDVTFADGSAQMVASSHATSTAGTDSDGLDYDIAISMILSALRKDPMPAF